ncbi:TetR/AcrR family transcriptional regulator [Arthrobacter psychrochitiniphilus]|uniref:TetR/AcrR family transcriptional regulator n=2 Tax=Arthrobacter psychrochitiniphilus TaxID=291045 RepID=A0A2V3DUI4_9MICC|nr:TetR/AcrR family transcriptional regulator [Arthrobacter psychrochitiniphilus]
MGIMGHHGDKAREALLDAAEELFAIHGVDAVSNRKIAEHVGTHNHSAVAYHFGNRDELIRALLERHLHSMQGRRNELLADLPEDAGLREVIACRILPWVEQLAAMPQPSWRAQFLYQVRSVPSAAKVLASSFETNDGFDELFLRMRDSLSNISQPILRARASVLGHLALGICAEFEAALQAGTQHGNWTSVGYFLIDAGAGMLAAPVTHSEDFLSPPTIPSLI